MVLAAAAFVAPLIIARDPTTAAMTNTAPPAMAIVFPIRAAPILYPAQPYVTEVARTFRPWSVKSPILRLPAGTRDAMMAPNADHFLSPYANRPRAFATSRVSGHAPMIAAPP